jgi:NADPH-dependent ferric siderophore reductase
MSDVGLVEVVNVSSPFPGLRSVEFKGDHLETFPAQCPAAHIKLFFDPNPEATPDLSFSEHGIDPIKRTYSVRHFDPKTRRLTVEFVVHSAPGAASDWARQARPGQRIGIAGPMMLDILSRTPRWNLFVGDLSALPMVSALVEALPQTAEACVLLELPTSDRVRFAAACKASVVQSVGERGFGLPSLVGQVTWPKQRDSIRVCVAAESTPTVSIRRYLQHEVALAKDCMYTVPFWKFAMAEDDYHDERHEEMDAMEE